LFETKNDFKHCDDSGKAKVIKTFFKWLVFILDGKIYFNGTVEELKASTGESRFEHAIANILTLDHAEDIKV